MIVICDILIDACIIYFDENSNCMCGNVYTAWTTEMSPIMHIA